jgi:hypothetical protein
VDSHAPGAFALRAFGDLAISRSGDLQIAKSPDRKIAKFSVAVLRRFRFSVPARVAIERGRPVRVTTDRIGIKGGVVEECAGPWRSSGGWWSARDPREAPGRSHDMWNRDEYDVALGDGAAYRIYRDRDEDAWFVEGILD